MELAPPQPEAAFKVLEADAAAELQQAAASHPHDAFLLAVLYARVPERWTKRARRSKRWRQRIPDSKLVAQLRASLLQLRCSPFIRTNDAQVKRVGVLLVEQNAQLGTEQGFVFASAVAQVMVKGQQQLLGARGLDTPCAGQ